MNYWCDSTEDDSTVSFPVPIPMSNVISVLRAIRVNAARKGTTLHHAFSLFVRPAAFPKLFVEQYVIFNYAAAAKLRGI